MTISGTNISMIRGNTESITVKLSLADGTPKALVSGDKVYFTVKKNLLDTVKALQKIVTTFVDGAAIITLAHTDTASMPILQYYYDVQITFADGTVKTVVGPAQFILTAEVTTT
jgi:hypothetical protein